MLRRLRTAVERPKREDGGFVAIEFVAATGILMLPVMLVVLTFPLWAERQSATRVAAREAARTFVLTGNATAAENAAFRVTRNYDIPNADVNVDLSGNPTNRGGTVVASVRVDVPVTNIAFLDFERARFTFTDTHREVVDLYRSQD